MRKKWLLWAILPVLIFLPSCFSFYQLNYTFNREFEDGQLEQALKTLKNSKMKKKDRVKLLYYMNAGAINSMLGNYEESNELLEKAYINIEDYHTNYWLSAASFLSNPTIVPYRGEDHEQLLVNYYKALNYLKMGQYNEALVECRRMNVRLHQIDDKYQNENKYQRDAFIHLMMGLLYEADGEINDAFIAYRNAYNIYKQDYERLFGLSAPPQLKQDLMRTAYLNGFDNELRAYEDSFNTTYHHIAPAKNTGEVVFLWNDGLGPVKDEWSINFAVQHGNGGWVTFANEDYDYAFPYYIGESSDDDAGGDKLGDLEFFRVAFPKYVERPLAFTEATISGDGKKQQLQLAEDVNKVAFQSLQQRMLKEFSTALLRVAVKKAAEAAARKKDDDLGTLLSAVNALTEKADTRNWQTIPHSIYYTRMRLPAGEQTLQLKLKGPYGTQTKEINFNVVANKMVFYTFHSLETAQKVTE